MAPTASMRDKSEPMATSPAVARPTMVAPPRSSLVTGPRWVTGQHGFDSLPLLVRPGSVIAVGSRDDKPDYDYPDGVALHLFGLEALSTAKVHVPALGGANDADDARFEVTRDGADLTVRRTAGRDLPWSVVLPAGIEATMVTGGEALPQIPGTGFGVRAVSDIVTMSVTTP